jgi:hypothetical protein
MGCALIPLSIVRALGPRPWFEYKDDDRRLADDLRGRALLREGARGRLRRLPRPGDPCGHLFTDFATEAHWTRYREVIAHTQERLAEMMTVTVTPTEAAVP